MPDGIQEANLLFQVCSLLLKAQGEEDVFRQIACEICQVFEAVCCSIWLAKPDGGVGQRRISYYQVPMASVDLLPTWDFRAAALVIKQQTSLILSDISADPYFSDKGRERLWLMAYPLQVQGDFVGVLCIWGRQGMGLYAKRDKFVSLLSQIIEEISFGLYNYKYFSNRNQKRLKKELEIARQIQQNLLPKEVPVVTGISLAIRNISANEVSGDYADVFLTRGGYLGIAVGDVMGKGIPAALWMAMTRVAMRTAAKDGTHPHVAMERVNAVLYPDLSRQGIFVTLLYAFFDPRKKTLFFSNAGHVPPLLYHSTTGQFELLKLKGTIIGGLEHKKYDIGGVQLQAGDIVIFYTDGLTEAVNAHGQPLGIENVADIIKKNSLYSAAEISDCLSLHLGQHIGDSHQTDDITFAILKVEGNGE